MELINKIEKLLKENHKTVDDLAKAIKKDRTTVYRYLSGNINSMPVSTLEAIAEYFAVSPNYLIGWDDNEWETKYRIARRKKMAEASDESDTGSIRMIKLPEPKIPDFLYEVYRKDLTEAIDNMSDEDMYKIYKVAEVFFPDKFE